VKELFVPYQPSDYRLIVAGEEIKAILVRT
jgi:hypothetical protein